MCLQCDLCSYAPGDYVFAPSCCSYCKKDGSNAKQMFSRITGLTASRIMQHIATRNNRVKHATSVPGWTFQGITNRGWPKSEQNWKLSSPSASLKCAFLCHRLSCWRGRYPWTLGMYLRTRKDRISTQPTVEFVRCRRGSCDACVWRVVCKEKL